MSAIDFIAAQPRVVDLGNGCVLELTPIRMKQVPSLARAVEPVLNHLMVLGDQFEPSDLLGLLASQGEAMMDAVAICSGKSPDELGQLQPDQFAILAAAVLEVNADFFAQALPRLKEQVSAVAPGLSKNLAALTPKPSTC